MSASRRFETSRADRVLSALHPTATYARRRLESGGLWVRTALTLPTPDDLRPYSYASSAYHPLAAGPETRPPLLLVELANASQRQLRNERDVFRRVSGSL